MGKTLLIVEDNPLLINLYETAFKKSGYDVKKAAGGSEALAVLKESAPKPDVIALDIMMSDMNGFEFLTKLKEDAGLSKIPVVILSNLAQQHDIDRALELGAVLYLVKSQYDPQEIVERVGSVFKRYEKNSE